MLPREFVIAIMIGAALAVPYVLYARRAARPRAMFGIGLIIAAALYVVFAAVAADLRAIAIEVACVVVFTVIALLGMRRWPAVLAFGWCAHVLWDLLLHPVQSPGYAPWWYPLICIGFDLLVGGCILGARDPRVKRARGE